MWFSPSITLNDLVGLCRILRHSLEAGISPVKIFQQQSRKGSNPLSRAAGRIAQKLQQGNSFQTALKGESGFPPLFCSLVGLGEQTGHLPEILQSLEEYYRQQQTLSRQFRSQITSPVLQFVLAVFLIAFVIWIFGILGSPSQDSSSLSLFGLRGTWGALIFLSLVFGTGFLIFLGYRQLARWLQGRALVDRLLLNLPGIGPCQQALALGRFTLALQLTLDTGMSPQKAAKHSLLATGNAAFESQINKVIKSLKAGEDLTSALSNTGLFPEDFRTLLAVAEESGSVPEVMQRQCQYYQEEAGRKLKALSQMAAWSVWLIYAIFAVLMIFQIAGVYLGSLGGR